MPMNEGADSGRLLDRDKIGHEILEFRVDKVYMVVFSLVMFCFAFTLALVGDMVNLWKIDFRFLNRDRWMFLACTILIVVFHEALHAFAALKWGKVPYSSVRFGFKWKWLAPYCHFSSRMRMGNFRVFLLLPLLVTTFVTGLVILLDPAIWTQLLFSMAFSGCSGDVLMYFKVQDYDKNLWVRDHPSEPGCTIWPEGETLVE